MDLFVNRKPQRPKSIEWFKEDFQNQNNQCSYRFVMLLRVLFVILPRLCHVCHDFTLSFLIKIRLKQHTSLKSFM